MLGSLTAVGTLPASAADAPAHSPSSSEQPASAGLLDAMQRDFGLTRAEAEDGSRPNAKPPASSPRHAGRPERPSAVRGSTRKPGG